MPADVLVEAIPNEPTELLMKFDFLKRDDPSPPKVPADILLEAMPNEPTTHRSTDATKACSGDSTPCRMTGVTLHSHIRFNELFVKFDLLKRDGPSP